MSTELHWGLSQLGQYAVSNRGNSTRRPYKLSPSPQRHGTSVATSNGFNGHIGPLLLLPQPREPGKGSTSTLCDIIWRCLCPQNTERYKLSSSEAATRRRSRRGWVEAQAMPSGAVGNARGRTSHVPAVHVSMEKKSEPRYR